MKRQSLIRFALALAAGAALLCNPTEASAQSSPDRHASLTGVWRVTRHGVDCNSGQDLNSFNVLMTFHSDGTMTAAGTPPGEPLASSTNEYGVWDRQDGDFTFHDVGYSYDENGTFTGSGEVTGTVHLTSASTFTYTSTICFFDPDGNQLLCICGRADGTRFR